MNGYRKSFAYNNFSNTRKGYVYNKLHKICGEDYACNYQATFEDQLIAQLDDNQKDLFNISNFAVTPQTFTYENGSLCFSYQAYYRDDCVRNRGSTNFYIRYPWHSWKALKTWSFFTFLLNTEDAPDFLLPWILFLLAVISSILTKLGVSAVILG
jgi:hypothetical protein